MMSAYQIGGHFHAELNIGGAPLDRTPHVDGGCGSFARISLGMDSCGSHVPCGVVEFCRDESQYFHRERRCEPGDPRSGLISVCGRGSGSELTRKRWPQSWALRLRCFPFPICGLTFQSSRGPANSRSTGERVESLELRGPEKKEIWASQRIETVSSAA